MLLDFLFCRFFVNSIFHVFIADTNNVEGLLEIKVTSSEVTVSNMYSYGDRKKDSLTPRFMLYCLLLSCFGGFQQMVVNIVKYELFTF